MKEKVDCQFEGDSPGPKGHALRAEKRDAGSCQSRQPLMAQGSRQALTEVGSAIVEVLAGAERDPRTRR